MFTWFTNWNLKLVFGSSSSNSIVFKEMTFSWQATCTSHGFYQAGKRADHSRGDQSPALWKCHGYGNRAPLLPEGCSLLVCPLIGCTAHLYQANECGHEWCWQKLFTFVSGQLEELRLWTQVVFFFFFNITCFLLSINLGSQLFCRRHSRIKLANSFGAVNIMTLRQFPKRVGMLVYFILKKNLTYSHGMVYK